MALCAQRFKKSLPKKAELILNYFSYEKRLFQFGSVTILLGKVNIVKEWKILKKKKAMRFPSG